MTFNPAAYSLTATQAVEKMEDRQKFEKENSHRALRFFVEGLQEIMPNQYPGEVAMIQAKSFEGKSTVIKAWAAICEQDVTSKAKSALTGLISHEDTAETSAEQQIERYGSKMGYVSSQMLYVGRSFGMLPEDIADLHMSNIARVLLYAQNEQFAEKKHFSALFYDYIQRTPPDPERRTMGRGDQMRFQMRDDVTRLCNAAVTFKCPVVFASQSTLKATYTPYSAEMPIPGPGDTDEAKEIYQIPDRAYGLWKVSQKYPTPGTMIESGAWKFQSAPDLFFLWCEKFRYYQPIKDKPRYAPIGRVFPIKIDSRGNFFYDKEYHKSIYVGA